MSDELDLIVDEIVAETPLIRTFRLVKEDGQPFKPLEAGAHVDVTGPTGILRQYSLCGDPRDTSAVLIAVKRETESRGGSAALHEVKTGDRLRVGKPRNLLRLSDEASHHVLIAGGIGVTPLLAMAYELAARGESFELVYFARSRDDAAFLSVLESAEQLRERMRFCAGYSIDQQQQVLEEVAAGVQPGTHVYTCGPAPFMDQVTGVFEPVVGAESVHLEHFVAEKADTSDDQPFTVELSTGEVFEVPADKSILSVLEDNGIEVFKSCTEGICGSCVSGLLEGEADHRDQCLSTAEKAANSEIALCVSRARSERLKIELY